YDHLSHVVGTKNYTLPALTNQPVETLIDLKEVLGETPTGVFNVRISSDQYQAISHLVVVTDIGIAAKLSEHDLLVWANSIHTLASVTGATVRVFSPTNQEIFQGLTDTNGLARFEVKPGKEKET